MYHSNFISCRHLFIKVSIRVLIIRMIIFVPSGRKNGEEASTSQMTSIAVLCASVAAFICLITVLVWHRLRNGGEQVNNRRLR